MSSCRAQRGLSLVELMVAMTLGLILLLGVTQLLLGSQRSFALQQQLAVTQENARFILTRISRDVRQVGLFGCLDLERLPTVTREQLPQLFAEPVSFEEGVLRLVTAVSIHDPVMAEATRSAAGYGARWLLASNCLDELRIARGSDPLQVLPGDLLIPVRQIEYRHARHSLQARINGVGNFETLIEGVAAFDVQFAVDGRYLSSLTSDQSARVRSVRLALQLLADPANPDAEQPRLQQYTLVAALRNRLE